MKTDAAIADAQARIDSIIAAGHTQFITIRVDTVEVLIEDAKTLEAMRVNGCVPDGFLIKDAR